jgi:hypothetical protein
MDAGAAPDSAHGREAGPPPRRSPVGRPHAPCRLSCRAGRFRDPGQHYGGVPARSGPPDHRVSRTGRERRARSLHPRFATPRRCARRTASRRAIATRSKARSSSACTTSSSPTARRAGSSAPCGGAPGATSSWPSRPPTSRSPSRTCAPPASAIPFERRARLEADDPGLARIQEVGWRTARLCAHETYMDCPYYEQLQYVGDTRIQALVSLYNSGDARLMRNAIDQIDDSRISSGATMSRYPTRLPQFIPSFSLWWIGMLHDYWWYVDDPAFVRRMLARRAPGPQLLRGPSEARWIARPAALVAFPRLDRRVAGRKPAAGSGRLLGALRLPAHHGARLGRGSGKVFGSRSPPTTARGPRRSPPRLKSLYWDAGPAPVRRHAAPGSLVAADQRAGRPGRSRAGAHRRRSGGARSRRIRS